MKFLFVDTNIFIQCCLLEIEGDDIGALKKLHDLLNEKKVKLILPEVVRLEFPRVLNSKTEDLKKKIGKYKEEINKDESLDDKIRCDLAFKLNEVMKERIKNTEKVKKEIESLFNDTNTITSIKIESSHIIEAYKKFVKGEKPYNAEQKGEVQSDCLIIEGLKEFFNDKKNYDFYFCSTNENDFALKENEKFSIHPEIKKSFENIKYYSNLYSLLNEEFGANYSEESITKLEDKKTEASVASISAGAYISNASPGYFVAGSALSDRASAMTSLDTPLTGTEIGHTTLGTKFDSTIMSDSSLTSISGVGKVYDPTVASTCKGCGLYGSALDKNGYCISCQGIYGQNIE